MGLIKLTSLCIEKENINKTKKTTYGMEENIFKKHDHQGQPVCTTQQQKNKQPNQKMGRRPI